MTPYFNRYDSCFSGEKGDTGVPGEPGSTGYPGNKGSIGEMGYPGKKTTHNPLTERNHPLYRTSAVVRMARLVLTGFSCMVL